MRKRLPLIGNAGFRPTSRRSAASVSPSTPTRSRRRRSSTASSCCAPTPISIRSRPCKQTFRTAKHLLATRPIFHKLDETIRGHVFCSSWRFSLSESRSAMISGHEPARRRAAMRSLQCRFQHQRFGARRPRAVRSAGPDKARQGDRLRGQDGDAGGAPLHRLPQPSGSGKRRRPRLDRRRAWASARQITAVSSHRG